MPGAFGDLAHGIMAALAWSHRPGRIALAASPWPRRPGRITLAAPTWPHCPGRITLPASPWPRRPGGITLAASHWPHRPGRIPWKNATAGLSHRSYHIRGAGQVCHSSLATQGFHSKLCCSRLHHKVSTAGLATVGQNRLARSQILSGSTGYHQKIYVWAVPETAA